MDWGRIRTHYATLFAQSGATQEAVAQAGHLHAQTAISKLLNNDKRGPSVETFARAVLGLGMTLSGFFATLEQLPERRPPAPAVQPQPRRSPDVVTPLSDTGFIAEPSPELNEQEFETFVKVQFDVLKSHLERLAIDLEQVRKKNRSAHRGPRPTRPRAGSRHRKSA